MTTPNYLERLADRKNSPAFNEFLNHFKQLDGCPVTATMQVIGGKWKPIILYLVSHDVNRFGELSHLIGGISRKVLTDQLRELERDGILTRTVAEGLPASVEYSLTEEGKSLFPIVEVMCAWGLEKSPEFRRPAQGVD